MLRRFESGFLPSGVFFIAVVLLVSVGHASAATESILLNFNGTNGNVNAITDGALIADSRGNLFGETVLGGTHNQGTVFEMSPPSKTGGKWTETILWSFGAGKDGADPCCSVFMDGQGNLFGATVHGGLSGNGTVFELSPGAKAGTWKESILWDFDSPSGLGDGEFPNGAPIMDASGNLYGTAYSGGAKSVGAIYKLSPPAVSGGTWSESILLSFAGGADGANPRSRLVMDSAGNLFGVTQSGSLGNDGTVFELSPPTGGSGSWSETIIWDFGQGSAGVTPYAGLMLDGAGNLFGTAGAGGAFGGGTVFELSPPTTTGGLWNGTALWDFGGYQTDGVEPRAAVTMDTAGNLYGTTYDGGLNANTQTAAGTAFKLTPAALGQWTESILWNFGKGTDGNNSRTSLHMDAAGNLYGTTSLGGTSGMGIVYEITQ